MIRRQLLTALIVVVVMTVGLGLVYPLVVTGFAQVAFHNKANDSIVKVNGKAVGSSLLGQRIHRQGRQRDPEVLPVAALGGRLRRRPRAAPRTSDRRTRTSSATSRA